jgi:carotenoid cleavage dioxygenase-like enzyme
MAAPFPDHKFLSGNWAPLRAEIDAPDLVVDGEMPAALHGTLYRNGPNPLHAPRDRYHLFSGDGMIHALTVADGRVRYRNRWVRTAKWQREAAAGRALFGTFGNPMTSDPEVLGEPFNVANTNVLFHGSRLLALEEGSPAFELDADTLESVGPWTWQGRMGDPFTAHPKIDPETGAMLFFGYGVGGFGSATMHLAEVAADGSLARHERFEAPYAAMVHDFVVTQKHIAMPVFPATTSLGRAASGGPPIAWDPSLPSTIGVWRRDAAIDSVRWFRGEPCYVYHPLGAFEDQGLLVADMVRYPAAPGFPGADGSRPDPGAATARLERWTLDLDYSTDSWRTEVLDEDACEFPRMDERFAGLPYRHGWAAAGPTELARDAVYDRIVHWDLETGARGCWQAPAGDFVGEPVFVPRDLQAAEGDGWLLVIVYRGATATSDLVVLAATDLALGPVATAHLDTRIPFGFHGNWRDLR